MDEYTGSVDSLTDLTPLARRRIERGFFDGLFLGTFAYGALIMVMLQVAQVLSLRPKRGRLFWAMLAYTAFICVASTIAMGGKQRFAQLMYIDNEMFDPLHYYFNNIHRFESAMEAICLMIMTWVADVLMIYRLSVLWNRNLWILTVPIVLHLGRIGLSIPMMYITSRNTKQAQWMNILLQESKAWYALSLAINLFITGFIAFRLYTMRHKAEQVLGKIQSVFYTSWSTVMVESGALLTLWSLVHLMLLLLEHWTSEIFRQPLAYLNAIARMLIILRMAQNRAWSRDTVTASNEGVLDWQVSSSHSIPLHDAQSAETNRTDFKKLPKRLGGF